MSSVSTWSVVALLRPVGRLLSEDETRPDQFQVHPRHRGLTLLLLPHFRLIVGHGGGLPASGSAPFLHYEKECSL